jgi:hypothetical protein
MIAMPNRVKVVVVMLALALVAGLLALALGAKPTQAQAQTDTFNQRAPIDGVFFNECTGEFVTYAGTEHVVIHRTEDASGGFHFKFHENIQVQGESASGAKYVAHEIDNESEVFSESADNLTITRTLQFIRQGSETATDDFLLKQLVHFTINANGELTSEVVNQKVECK